jgi:hypothetical protein
MSLLGIGSVIAGISNAADELFLSDEERTRAAIELKRIDADVAKEQVKLNAVEAQQKSIFIAGWRPAIGWIGAVALAYQFVIYPLLVWVWAFAQAQGWLPNELSFPPVLPADALFSIVLGMLGIGGMRSWDKRNGTQTDNI